VRASALDYWARPTVEPWQALGLARALSSVGPWRFMSSLRFERVIIPLVRELLMTVLESKCQVYRRISQGEENWELF
jgi:hypothetical protein